MSSMDNNHVMVLSEQKYVLYTRKYFSAYIAIRLTKALLTILCKKKYSVMKKLQ